QAKESFARVFQNRTQFGLYTSNEKEDGNYLFTTMQTISRENWMHEFAPDHFDAIIIDEVHRAGSKSYQKIFDYFQPDLWLGMSATPERTDDFDIYALFDHNIAYEIRLNQALEADLLCPFHYFGIHDLYVDAQENELSDFRYLTCDERVDHIIRQANYYGYSGDRVKGLIFVSRVEEGKALSEKFNARGFRTVALSGSDSHEYRERCIERLSSDAREDGLDYIFTVEIFNEGIDIPSINQVIMLRPTESPIIFVQQMGRGLRKNKEKEFVVILDFIGNYQNNYMIPIALSSDRTYNKDTLRRFVQEGERLLPGSSTIHFDEVSKKEIFKAIDTANLQTLKLIKESYTDLKQKLGCIPTLIQFDEFGSIDPLKIIDHSGSYPAFLQKYEKDRQYNLPKLHSKQLKILEYISKKFAAGKRIHELLLLEEILNNETDLFETLQDRLI
ncbi:DEAD/DEAH box helicase, partial [uncultured Dubosiella sp.]